MKLSLHLVPGRPLNRYSCLQTRTPMLILLRNTKTGLYYQNPNLWTANPKEAWAFRHTAQAIGLVYQAQLPDMEVLLTFDEPAHNIRFPLTPSVG